MVVAAAIAGVVALVAAVVWWTSDARATISLPAATPVPSLKPAKAVPDSLTPAVDRAQPRDHPAPGGRRRRGHRQRPRYAKAGIPPPATTLWSYARDLDLCGVTWVYSYAVAVYPDGRGCGQVSTVDAETGKRGPSPYQLLRPGGHPVRRRHDGALGRRHPAGDVALGHGADAQLRRARRPHQAGHPRRRRCAGFVSAAASSAAVSVLEACQGQDDLRLTLLRPSDEEDTPELKYVQQTGVTDGSGRPSGGGDGHDDGGVRPHPEAEGRHHRRDGRDDRQHRGPHAARRPRPPCHGPGT